MLAKSKLDSIETLISQALIDIEIRHEEFDTIMKERKKYEKVNENLRNSSEILEEKIEIMRLNNVNSRLTPQIVSKISTDTHKFVWAFKL